MIFRSEKVPIWEARKHWGGEMESLYLGLAKAKGRKSESCDDVHKSNYSSFIGVYERNREWMENSMSSFVELEIWVLFQSNEEQLTFYRKVNGAAVHKSVNSQ